MIKNELVIRPNVLVIEDDTSISRMLRFSLTAAGFGITEVSTGIEALGRMETDHPSAVVLDLGLSDGNASTVLDRLRNDSGGNLAWVAISSLDRQEASAEHGPFGDHYLGKPFNPWDLMEILKQMLAGEGRG